MVILAILGRICGFQEDSRLADDGRMASGGQPACPIIKVSAADVSHVGTGGIGSCPPIRQIKVAVGSEIAWPVSTSGAGDVRWGWFCVLMAVNSTDLVDWRRRLVFAATDEPGL